ncbi:MULTISPECIES: hypothetical protein [Kitasatospora]|uniref:Uncharacterized protein n=1 Tax=Kitasatospora setae (strain ATCC 33774 / DSM 43861 / JCM 3304 / KCC A-0304 / NBRC 14216 / KM-6054) TaxID=452652 RepID=E4NEB2_KITSK|nr:MULTISPECIES: hypothetical protein [Kitasatospora]BAJ29543.1 hypothetical protein KSE_37430 [Kitasatospora setae KM-6054]
MLFGMREARVVDAPDVCAGGYRYDPVAQLGWFGAVPADEAEGLGYTTHTTTLINSEDGDA